MSDSFVYFIQQGRAGPIKIGRSRDPIRRLRQLQTAHSEPLRLLHAEPGDPQDETQAHELFAEARIAGEWFRPTLGLVWHIRDLILVDAYERGCPMSGFPRLDVVDLGGRDHAVG